MATVQKTYALNPGTDISAVVDAASQALSGQGYEVQTQVMSPAAAAMTVSKDRSDGFKNFVGLGIECRANLSVLNGNQLTVAIDSEWTNKIIAIALGWFLCWIVFITGIVGAINQNGLPEKVANAIMMATAQAGNNGNNGYNGYNGNNGVNGNNGYTGV